MPGMVIQQLGLRLKLNRYSAPLQRTPEPEDQITKISLLFHQLQQLKQKNMQNTVPDPSEMHRQPQQSHIRPPTSPSPPDWHWKVPAQLCLQGISSAKDFFFSLTHPLSPDLLSPICSSYQQGIFPGLSSQQKVPPHRNHQAWCMQAILKSIRS